ncbi:hypothetical protein COU62_02000 [Candidatus Pacearchaeota archaeon CG10_big_fil_rev_8_21_14_0_10_35_219]|nr:hypothetical protein [Candidatus Pacearchaeota archaeon]OIO42522.1 MAG: hypothetical protein AUJ63_02460 [Candidatus Pacearchaeota archaeon CG1_02_35_32]PIO07965.1 MAG: hypothetical protein COU62_02000 [Candidatus Pacearchaeota archaeon CG10_big_fil_rev_8_21_14_0_10_35_219]PIY81420.1 MAG: hypothetical protein COY79_02810 [Candidatus Pacearchaeota archaeon CG_4_10_14_0_8_um_filter_35_169]PIZ80616.1 MAG: hypothetical protein COY00_00635 [Candidatus Pacearchaeota archaeon CG_4_10_14_0_2_um_filt
MKKEKRQNKKRKIINLKRNLLFSAIIVFSIISLVYASTFVNDSRGDFDLGTSDSIGVKTTEFVKSLVIDNLKQLNFKNKK